VVLSAAIRGGAACRVDMVETEPCAVPVVTSWGYGGVREWGEDSCGGGRGGLGEYRYRLGRWSECVPLKDDDDRGGREGNLLQSLGQIRRSVQCVNQAGFNLEIRWFLLCVMVTMSMF